MKIQNAIISVSNKEGIVSFVKELSNNCINIYSTGNTYKKLKENKIKVSYIEVLTGMNEMLDGRVRTLHPNVHGGILYKRDNQNHKKTLKNKNIQSVDLVVVNLYPFNEVIKNSEIVLDEAIENIDIGGCALIRAAAKNYRWVTVICDKDDLTSVLEEIKKNGNSSLETRTRLAVKAFHHTMKYDGYIATFLNKRLLNIDFEIKSFKKQEKLRYGENPHQSSAIYKELESCDTSLSLPHSQLIHGKTMSYNNYLDGEAAINTNWEFKSPTAVVIKHQNPCGIATGKNIVEALMQAWQGDIVSAFGSVISLNRQLTMEVAIFLKDKFVEIIIAPDFQTDALEFLINKSKNLRIIKISPPESPQKQYNYKYIKGGLLKQEKDETIFKNLYQVSPNSDNKLDKANIDHYRFSYTCVKHVKSNAIVITHEYQPSQYMLLGMGAGQPNRVDAISKLALTKMKENIDRLYPQHKNNILPQLILASDAFFPFKDNIDYANQGGIKKIIQPGGSKRDQEVIDQAKKYNMEMVFTHVRHFLH